MWVGDECRRKDKTAFQEQCCVVLKAVYTAISVACGWEGAVVSLCKPHNSKIRNQKLDNTDGRTDIASYRDACKRLRIALAVLGIQLISKLPLTMVS